MTTVTVPNTFQNRTGTSPLKDLDDNFTTLANAITAGTSATVLDGGSPTTIFTAGAKLDMGSIT
jgi:hypothetical protein